MDDQVSYWRASRQIERVAKAGFVVSLVVALITAATVPSMARAVAVTIQNPLHGAEYEAPYGGPLTVDFTGAAQETYDLSVNGPGYIWEAEHIYTGDNPSFSQQFPDILEPGSYLALVEDSSGNDIATATFTVLGLDDAEIVSPNSGQTFLGTMSGDISVAWSSIANPNHTYRVDIERNGSLQERCEYLGGAIDGTTTHCPVSLGVGQYEALVLNSSTDALLDDISFNVAPRLRLSDVRVGPAKFFPLVRDGFKDTTKISFRTNKASRNSVEVMRGSRTIRRIDLGNQVGGPHGWTWNGKDRDGRKVAPGSYKLQVTTKAQGETKKAGGRVEVDTRVLRRNFSKSRRGTDFRSRGKRGNCNFDSNAGEALLTCLFGVAWTDYAFQMSPGSLRHIVRGPIVHGAGFRYRNGLVRCHPANDAARRGRTLLTRFISNGSNGWSQCWVVSATVRYHYFYRQ
ncbi:MAG TPA: FlgD immunoglobulin-like domain containing protein [Pyrinomonadaceae bacterium]|nr:FlgD immunoglobulin-like domain containing protein [Pyrinomonadaceae bacterium]